MALCFRRCGKFLLEMEKATGILKQGDKPPRSHDASAEPQTLAQIGLKYDQSVRMQCAGLIPDDDEAYREVHAELNRRRAGMWGDFARRRRFFLARRILPDFRGFRSPSAIMRLTAPTGEAAAVALLRPPPRRLMLF